MCCRSSSTCPWHMTESTDLVDQLSPLASRPLSCSVRRRLPFPPSWRRGTTSRRRDDGALPHLRVLQSLPMCESRPAASAAMPPCFVCCFLLSERLRLRSAGAIVMTSNNKGCFFGALKCALSAINRRAAIALDSFDLHTAAPASFCCLPLALLHGLLGH